MLTPAEGPSRGRPQSWPAPLLIAMALAAVAGGAAWSCARRFGRYEVAGESMRPTLSNGDWVIVDREAYARRLPRPGHVVLACDPREPDREVVKRVMRVDLHDGAWLEGDNYEMSSDSRLYGTVPRRLILGRVRWRYWPGPGIIR